MATLRFLHLSDWHQGRPDFDREVVRQALLKDLADKGPLDFIVFSGDLAWSGKPKEFEAARREFLEPVLSAVGLTPDRLFLVPGNHDLDRDELRLVPAELAKPLVDEKAVQYWQTEERLLNRALEPLAAFERFVQQFNKQSRPGYASVRTIKTDDATVMLVGLDTAWMSSRCRDQTDKVDDFRHLVVGEPQTIQAYELAQASDLQITVMHHAFDWLAPFDRSRVEGRICAWSDIVLWGHDHEPTPREQKTPQGNCTILPAGAVFDRRVAAHPRWTNAYSVVTVDLGGRKGNVRVRQWSDVSNRWIDNQDIGKDGTFTFALPKRLKTKAPTSHRSKEARMAAADRRYRDLLLEACDIVDLANLPEQDRHLATQTLELRRLYVPLRVQVEPITESSDIEEVIERLELRRAAALSLADSPAGPEEEAEEGLASVGARLTQARRLIVLGDPGGGKTTLTRWIATAYLLRLNKDPSWRELPDVTTLPDEDLLPVLIRCRDLDEKARAGSLSEVLHHTLRQAELGDSEAKDIHTFLMERISAKRALLILDGLDEIASPRGRILFCERIEKIAKANRHLPIIATSRIVGYRELGRRLGQRFEHLTIAPFGPAEKDTFVQRWCELAERPERRAQAAAELIADIHSGDRIERLTGNPMLLTTMALVKRKVGKLPHRRALLYWEAVQVMLNWRSEVDAPLNVDEALPQLYYLAYTMCEAGVQRLREDEILAHLEAMRARYRNLHAVHTHTPMEFLRLLESRTALMMESGRENHLGKPVPVWEFRHLTFQEYLAARAMVEGIYPGHNPDRGLPGLVGELAGRVGEETEEGEQWREAIRLCLTICKNDDVDPALRAILRAPEGAPPRAQRARAILGALCLADEPNATSDCAAEVLRAFASEVAEGDDDTGIGGGSAWTQAQILLGEGRWLSALESALTTEFFSRDFLSRVEPGAVLSGIAWRQRRKEFSEDNAIADELTAKLRSADDRTVAAAALASMHGAWEEELTSTPDLIAALFACLDRPPAVAHAATWALAWLTRHGGWKPAPEQIERLTETIRDRTNDPEQVRWAVHIIGKSGGFCEQTNAGEELADAVLYWVESGTPLMRRSIAAALRPEMGWSRTILLSLLHDSSVPVQHEALRSLTHELDGTSKKIILNRTAQYWYYRREISNDAINRIALTSKIPVYMVVSKLREINELYGMSWSIPDDALSSVETAAVTGSPARRAPRDPAGRLRK